MSARDRMDPALKGVVWTRTAKEAHRDRAPLAGDLEIDLAIVGGGFCGLAAALQGERPRLDGFGLRRHDHATHRLAPSWFLLADQSTAAAGALPYRAQPA